MSAVMTHKGIVYLMISKRNTAIWTVNRGMAMAAAYDCMITASVEQ